MDLKVSTVENGLTDKKPTARKKLTKAKQAALNHPMVLEAQRIFDGEIVTY